MSGINAVVRDSGKQEDNVSLHAQEYWKSDKKGHESWWNNTNWFNSSASTDRSVIKNTPNDKLERQSSQSDQIDALVSDQAEHSARTGGANVFNRFTTQVKRVPVSKTATKAARKAQKKSRADKISALVSNLGYDQSVVQQLNELVLMPLFHPTLFKSLGVRSARGVLLTGASGSGKTSLMNELLNIMGSVYVRKIDAADLIEQMTKFLRSSRKEDHNGKGRVNGKTSRSENPLCVLFDSIRKHQPSILFIDQLELIAGTGDGEAAQNKEDVAVLHLRAMLALEFDNLARAPTDVVVLAVTNDSTQICSSLLRAGRFEKQIALRRPDETQRLRTLLHLTKKMKLDADDMLRTETLAFVAEKTEGYLLADLDGLCREAGLECLREVLAMPASDEQSQTMMDSETTWIDDESGKEMKRTNSHYLFMPQDGGDTKTEEERSSELLAQVTVGKRHFAAALQRLQPSSMREVNVEVPKVQRDDIGGYDSVKEQLLQMVEYPMKHTHLYSKFHLPTSSGVLLYGPPGCGKTSMAKMVATTCGCRFLSVKGPELLSSYIGQSEANIRKLFAKARENAPCVLFFDEIDAVSTKRTSRSDQTVSRVVAQLLIEMESSREHKDRSRIAGGSSQDAAQSLQEAIFIIAATNRPDMMDDAFLRPGRLDQLIYVGLPNEQGRKGILKACLRKTPRQADVDAALVEELAQECHRFSGADLNGLCNMARQQAVRECIELEGRGEVLADDDPRFGVSAKHMRAAFRSTRPSVGLETEQEFLMWNMKRGAYGKALEAAAQGEKGDLLSVEQLLSKALTAEKGGPQTKKKKKKASTPQRRVANRAR
jgi:SpoVK/Ycf46/Vps4 family AAA+-type ATPase